MHPESEVGSIAVSAPTGRSSAEASAELQVGAGPGPVELGSPEVQADVTIETIDRDAIRITAWWRMGPHSERGRRQAEWPTVGLY